MNWLERGREDGAKGLSAQKANEYSEACAEHSIKINRQAYDSGRSAGLRAYCTFEKGQAEGLNGESYAGVCPQDLQADFLRGYNLGVRERELNLRRQEVERREREVKQKEAEVRALKRVTESRHINACNSSLDCQKDGDCAFGKCRHNGMTCRFSSDCKINGFCSRQSEAVDGVIVHLNVCRY